MNISYTINKSLDKKYTKYSTKTIKTINAYNYNCSQQF